MVSFICNLFTEAQVSPQTPQRDTTHWQHHSTAWGQVNYITIFWHLTWLCRDLYMSFTTQLWSDFLVLFFDDHFWGINAKKMCVDVQYTFCVCENIGRCVAIRIFYSLKLVSASVPKVWYRYQLINKHLPENVNTDTETTSLFNKTTIVETSMRGSTFCVSNAYI